MRFEPGHLVVTTLKHVYKSTLKIEGETVTITNPTNEKQERPREPAIVACVYPHPSIIDFEFIFLVTPGCAGWIDYRDSDTRPGLLRTLYAND